MSTKKVIASLEFEINQIDKLFDSYSALLESCKEREPDFIELTALGSVVHSFYNGIENIFMQIAKKVDQDLPSDSHWHRNLLVQMSTEQEGREAVISEDLKLKLVEYLGFRHFYRHSYSFFLRWNELSKLVIPLPEVWKQLRDELTVFIDSLSDE